MLLAVRMTLTIVIILCVAVQLVDERIVHVSEPSSDNKEFFTKTSGDAW